MHALLCTCNRTLPCINMFVSFPGVRDIRLSCISRYCHARCVAALTCTLSIFLHSCCCCGRCMPAATATMTPACQTAWPITSCKEPRWASGADDVVATRAPKKPLCCRTRNAMRGRAALVISRSFLRGLMPGPWALFRAQCAPKLHRTCSL